MKVTKVKEIYFVEDCTLPFYVLEDNTIMMPISNPHTGFVYRTIEKIREEVKPESLEAFEKAYETLSPK